MLTRRTILVLSFLSVCVDVAVGSGFKDFLSKDYWKRNWVCVTLWFIALAGMIAMFVVYSHFNPGVMPKHPLLHPAQVNQLLGRTVTQTWLRLGYVGLRSLVLFGACYPITSRVLSKLGGSESSGPTEITGSDTADTEKVSFDWSGKIMGLCCGLAFTAFMAIMTINGQIAQYGMFSQKVMTYFLPILMMLWMVGGFSTIGVVFSGLTKCMPSDSDDTIPSLTEAQEDRRKNLYRQPLGTSTPPGSEEEKLDKPEPVEEVIPRRLMALYDYELPCQHE